MDAMSLSPRLALVASFVPENARLADIGSDHAYLPAHLLLTGKISFAVAGEVAVGPLENVQHEIERTHLSDQLIGRLGDGFAAIEPADEIDTVTIAGMGGRLIADILTAGHAQGQQYQHLILQPNIDVDVVRTWLQENGYALVDETMVFDDNHYYEVLVAEPGVTEFTDQQLKFGPFNLERQPEVWQARWQQEAQRINTIMAKLAAAEKTAAPAYLAYQTERDQILEVLS